MAQIAVMEKEKEELDCQNQRLKQTDEAAVRKLKEAKEEIDSAPERQTVSLCTVPK